MKNYKKRQMNHLVNFDYSKWVNNWALHFGDVGDYRFTLKMTDGVIDYVNFVPRPLPSKKGGLECLVYEEYNRLDRKYNLWS